MADTTLDPTLTLSELARHWGWSQDRLRRKVKAGTIPHLRIDGRIYFELSAVEAWKAAARRGEAPAPAQEDSSRARRRTEADEYAALGLPHGSRYAR